jgi:chemotaxis protein MotB
MSSPGQAPAPMRLSHRRRRRRPTESANHERWLVSYADFITLLFAFFTTLYAISTVDAKKLNSMVESMHEAFRSDGTAHGVISNTPSATGSTAAGPHDEAGPVDLHKKIAARLAQPIAEKRVDIERDRRGIVISIRESGSFSVGSADLSSEARALLTELGDVLSGVGNQVRVEGHTDNTPIHTARFASNWELSTARATNVIAFLLDHTQVRADHLSASGYAEHHPHADNSSDANRTRNRRVDIVILSPDTRASEEPSTVMTAR